MTLNKRTDLAAADFAIPETRRYPINNEAAAREAMTKVVEFGTEAEQETVRNAVLEKFPALSGDMVFNNSEDVFLTNQLQEVTTNVTPRVRHEMLEGRSYKVVPMVMLTEGVHAGSNGPLYYPREELAKTPVVWNHKPVVVYHPTMNGQAISACEPAVISKRKVGIILNTKWEPGKKGAPGKLTAEAWLETNRLGKVDQRVADAVQNGKMMEVSTGLFTDNQQVDGLWNKEAYSSIARNYRPDHLAILPDEKGACSIADGAGLMRNASKSVFVSNGKYLKKGATMATRKQVINGLITNATSPWDEDDREFLTNMEVEQFDKLAENAGIKKKSNGQDYISDDGDDNGETLEDGAGQVKPKKMGSKSGATANCDSPPMKGKKGKKADEEEEDTETTRNSAPVTVEEYINNAPEGMRDVLASGVRALTANKAKLIGQIMTNKACLFTKQQLATKPIDELQALAALAAPVQTARPVANNYLGLGDAGMPEPMVNVTTMEALPIPTLNFSRKD